MRRAGAIGLLAGAIFAGAASTAWAAPANVDTTPFFTFTAPSYDHEAGTVATLTYSSLFVPHNAVSTDTQPNGENLFDSATITEGSTPINGTQYLPPGDYPFVCTIHAPFMASSLHVTGTPLPRPVRGPPVDASVTTAPPDAIYKTKKKCKKKKGKPRKRCKRKRRRGGR